MPNHLHIAAGYKPHQLVTDLLQDIKGSSSKWINEKNFIRGKFNRQAGYGTFFFHILTLIELCSNAMICL
jgi:REP element-mobilizing transposase RayT